MYIRLRKLFPMSNLRPFHLAIPVQNLELCRSFYREILECSEGRSSEQWVDFNLFGHQLVIHQKEGYIPQGKVGSNAVDGHAVPIPHFGVVLSMEDWKAFANMLTSKKIEFIIEPYIRFEGQIGEQGTLFFQDPEGNALEFKGFEDPENLFAK